MAFLSASERCGGALNQKKLDFSTKNSVFSEGLEYIKGEPWGYPTPISGNLNLGEVHLQIQNSILSISLTDDLMIHWSPIFSRLD